MIQIWWTSSERRSELKSRPENREIEITLPYHTTTHNHIYPHQRELLICRTPISWRLKTNLKLDAVIRMHPNEWDHRACSLVSTFALITRFTNKRKRGSWNEEREEESASPKPTWMMLVGINKSSSVFILVRNEWRQSIALNCWLRLECWVLVIDMSRCTRRTSLETWVLFVGIRRRWSDEFGYQGIIWPGL